MECSVIMRLISSSRGSETITLPPNFIFTFYRDATLGGDAQQQSL
jgi:hypothetical protein